MTEPADASDDYRLVHANLDAVLPTLTDIAAAMMRMRHGLDGGQPRTLFEVGTAFGITRERARQVERREAAKLRDAR